MYTGTRAGWGICSSLRPYQSTHQENQFVSSGSLPYTMMSSSRAIGRAGQKCDWA